jgi:hypothetical protein
MTGKPGNQGDLIRPFYTHISHFMNMWIFFTNRFMMVQQEHCEQTQQNCVANSIGEEL